MFPPLSPQPSPDTTSTAQQVVEDQNAPSTQESKKSAKLAKLHEEFRARIDVCKSYRRKLIANWTVSIDYRRGKPFQSQTDEDQVAVNLDWSLTKAKTAALFSQVPKVRLSHGGDTLPSASPWASKLESKINDTLIQAGIETAMDECLPDCINAAGIGVVLVSYDVMTEDRQVPKHDPTLSEDDSTEPEMETIPHVLDHRYTTQRISPADLLWPINFTGANFDDAPWIGRTGRVTWAEAVQKFGLTEEDHDKVVGEGQPVMDRLSHDVERDKIGADDMVIFEEIFYKEFKYNEEAQSYTAIHHLVFVSGKEKPVVDEPWNGQQVQPDGSVVGAVLFPIRVLTLTYITDETIPPSDSAIGRPQVNEINKARTQMIKQRERSLPIRWFDVNRVDPAIQQGLMKGTWQAMIPVQGEGTRTIGEVSRAQMPQENFMFDKIAKSDLNEEWTIGPNASQIEAASVGDPLQNKQGFNTQAGRERAKVASFFVGIAQVLGGLICLYEDPSIFGEGFNPSISKILTFSVLADSTVLLDASQKLFRMNQFVNMYAKSGWINIEPVLQEIAILTGLEPSVVKAPSPKPPVEPNISLRLTGVEDMLNPLTLAFLMKSGQAPDAALIEQAKALIQQAVVPPQAPQDPTQAGMPPQAGGPPQPGQPPQPGAPPIPPGLPHGVGAPLPAPVQGPPPGSPSPSPQPPKMGEAHPNWATMPAINKRSEGNQS
jgi:hypothetical protein